jgi:hypothetical protein
MKRVAEALGEPYLAATDYDAYRDRAPKATRDLLRTSAQIVKLVGSWTEALGRADLRPRLTTSPKGLSVVEAIGDPADRSTASSSGLRYGLSFAQRSA